VKGNDNAFLLKTFKKQFKRKGNTRMALFT